jgi:hypothetical protein
VNIDFYNNSFALTGITGSRLINYYSYDLTITLRDDGTVTTEYANIYIKTGKPSNPWQKTTGFLLYSYEKAMKDLIAKIVSIGKSEVDYKKYEQAAMSNVEFVYAIVKNLTDLAFNDFAKTYISESVFSVRGRVIEVKEFGEEINGTMYKYYVHIGQNFDDNMRSNVVFTGLGGDYMGCRVYTNRDAVIRLSKSATTTLKGKMVKMGRSLTGAPIMYLVEE